MPDPIQIESSYQAVLVQFETTNSIRHQYSLFREFINELNGEYKRYETYIIQLAEKVPVYTIPLTWTGLDPQEIEADIHLFETIASELQLLKEDEIFKKLITRLREICIILYCYLNNYSKANKHLSILCGFQFLLNKSDKKNESLITEFKNWLEAVILKNHDYNAEVRSTLQRLDKQLHFILDDQYSKALVPVVEKYEHSESAYIYYSRLRLLSVDIYGIAEEKDQILQNFRVYGAEKPVTYQKLEAVAASRKLFESQFSNINNTFFKGGISFEISGAIHDGDSANFAISALWHSQLFKATVQRGRYEVNSRAAITGNIDEEGNILLVEEESIAHKVKAAFFSWAQQLVVPYKQRELFEKELQKLQQKYPNRKLDLIGINHLRELFFDRRLASHQVQSWFKYYFNRAKSQKYRVITMPLIVLLLLIIARLIFGPIDQNPDSFHYEGSSLILQNQYGSEVKRFEVGAQTASVYNHASAIAAYPLAILSDINNDGFNEVFYGKRNRLNQTKREISEVTSYSVNGDSIIWSQELLLNYEFPRQSGVSQQEMLIREIGLVQTPDGPKLIVNANSYYYFQTIVYMIDAKTGVIESEYLHIGHLRDMILQDITGDGVDEVILVGINNAFWQASVAILETQNFHGHSPLTADYKPAEMNKAQELFYILIPKTVIGSYVNPVMKYNEGKSIYYDIANNTIRILVEEARTTFRNQYGEVMVSVSFDESLRPVGIGTSDVYDIVARQLFEEGEIDKVPDYDYFQAFKDSIKYWRDNKFVTTQQYFQNE